MTKYFVLEKLAEQAGRDAYHNDLTASYRTVRILAGRSGNHSIKGVKTPEGELVTDALASKQVWQKHFATFFKADITALDPSLFHNPPNIPNTSPPLTFSIEEVERGIKSLRRNKGVGEDGNEAETLHAGGEAITKLLHGVINASCKLLYAPAAWRGGRIISLYKGKGDPSVADNNRGLLISEHASKVFTGLLRDRIEPNYNKYIPQEQFGCVSARGTIFATHIVRSFLDYCSMLSLCSFVLFVDLSKAFDFAIREILLGWRQGLPGNEVNHLIGLGLLRDDAVNLIQELLEGGCLLEYIGCDTPVCEMINPLHTNSWFRFGDCDTVVVSNRGGRQGCKMGGHILTPYILKP